MENLHCRSLSSIHIHYNQARVGGLSMSPDPARRIVNLQLAGGSTHDIPKVSRPHEHVQSNATAVVAQFAQGRRSRQDLQKMRGVDVAE